jgi:hypothetical protein
MKAKDQGRTWIDTDELYCVLETSALAKRPLQRPRRVAVTHHFFLKTHARLKDSQFREKRFLDLNKKAQMVS